MSNKKETYLRKYKKTLDFKNKSLYSITNEVTDKGVKQLVSYCLSPFFIELGNILQMLRKERKKIYERENKCSGDFWI